MGADMNRLSKKLIALCAVMAGWSVTVERVLAQQEHFIGGFDPKEWNIGHQADDENQVIIEFVRSGEDINSWTELVTLQIFRKPRSPETVDVLVPAMHQEISRRCPTMMWNVIDRQFASDTEEAGMLYEWAIKDCPPDADQHEIARLAYGKFNIFRVAYTVKTPELAPETRKKWIEDISTARIVRTDGSSLVAAVSLPITVEKVWYRTEKVRLFGMSYEKTGAITIGESSVEFTDKKGGVIRIPSESIQTVTRGKLTPDLMNDWIIVHYTDSGKDAVAAFTGALFSGDKGDRNGDRIYSAILSITKSK